MSNGVAARACDATVNRELKLELGRGTCRCTRAGVDAPRRRHARRGVATRWQRGEAVSRLRLGMRQPEAADDKRGNEKKRTSHAVVFVGVGETPAYRMLTSAASSSVCVKVK